MDPIRQSDAEQSSFHRSLRYHHPFQSLASAQRILLPGRGWILGTHHPERRYWPSFCEATGKTDLLNNPHFTDDVGRPINFVELIEIFDEVLATRTRDEWMEMFQERGLMLSSVQHISEVASDPQALANDYVAPFDHPTQGRLNLSGYPVHFSACRSGTQRAAPALGQHTDEILREIGCGDSEIDVLRQEGVIR